MFANKHFDSLREMFEDQFQPDGTTFLYRKGMKGPPIRVSEAERDRFVQAFHRQMRYAAWSMVLATFLVIALLVMLFPDASESSADAVSYAGTGVLIAMIVLGYHLAWNAPTRALRRRPVEGNALNREEVRQLVFSRISYAQLAIGLLSAVAILWNAAARQDALHGWGIFWLIFGGGLILTVAVQAFRKWRFERGQ